MTDDFIHVRSFLYEHMHEESGHERWVLNDLEAVGVSSTVCNDYQASPRRFSPLSATTTGPPTAAIPARFLG